MSRLISIVTVAHFAEDYSDGWYYHRIIVWFSRIPVRLNNAPAVRTRLAQWMILKQGFD